MARRTAGTATEEDRAMTTKTAIYQALRFHCMLRVCQISKLTGTPKRVVSKYTMESPIPWWMRVERKTVDEAIAEAERLIREAEEEAGRSIQELLKPYQRN